MDEVLKSIWTKIKVEWKIAFFSAFIVGILTHAFAMTNNFLTTDSMWNLVSEQDMISLGRQFLTYACEISSDFSLPWLNGLLAVLYLSAAAVLFAESFDVKSPMLIFLISALTVTFPVIAATFAYSYTVDGYSLSIVLSILAFVICDRTKYGFLISAVILSISLGIYQSYYSVTILLCIFTLILMVLRRSSGRDIWNKMWRYLFAGGGVLTVFDQSPFHVECES